MITKRIFLTSLGALMVLPATSVSDAACVLGPAVLKPTRVVMQHDFILLDQSGSVSDGAISESHPV